jgi:hypothetical protein
MTRGTLRPQRVRIFVGCEGDSEQSYSKFLYGLVNDNGGGFHLDAHILKGGDPLACVKNALSKIERETMRRGQYSKKFVFLDSDLVETRPENSAEAIRIAAENGLVLIWQKPDHEGLLALHFTQLGHVRPNSKDEIEKVLRQHWPTYKKAANARDYAKILTVQNVRCAAAHDPDFEAFIKTLGLQN